MMSNSIPIERAAKRLAELVLQLKPGDEIVLTDHDRPVARILPSGPKPARRRIAGNCKGMLIIHQDDDDHLRDFGDYMP
jgi:antitoxin (DNA-binding transcriptional repressor) of toxin-antitoxin stability system